MDGLVPAAKREVNVNTETEQNWDEAFARIQRGESSGSTMLKQLASPGLRIIVGRIIGRERADPFIEDVVLTTVVRIRSGDCQDGTRLRSLLLQVTRQKLQEQQQNSSTIPPAAATRNPELAALTSHLLLLAPREREALIRYYVGREEPNNFLKELGLSRDNLRELAENSKRVFKASQSRLGFGAAA